MPDGNALPPRGHNNPPPYDEGVLTQHATKASEFLNGCGAWLDLGRIENEDDAQRLNDFIAGVKKNRKAADAARAEAKKPHDDAGKAVQAAFKPIIEKFDKAAAKVQPMLTAWLQEQDRQRRAEAQRREDEARRQREEADRLDAQAAARNDVAGEVDAEAAREAAEKAAKDAARFAKGRANVASATGGGRTAALRTYVRAEVKNLRVAFMEFQDAPEVADCLRQLAERRARSKGFDPVTDKIPGFDLIVERKAV